MGKSKTSSPVDMKTKYMCIYLSIEHLGWAETIFTSEKEEQTASSA